MIKLFDRNSTKLTISEFYDNYEQGKYKFDVKYQRKSNVWNEDKKSFLIDSILKNYPMPPIFMRPNIDTSKGKTKYDIVDGKQRLEAIIGFINNEIPLTAYFFEDDIFVNGASDIEKDISGKLFSEIQAEKRFGDFIKQFWTYSINIDYLYEDDMNLISNIFDRLNRNGEPLTPQELRNAKFHQTHLLERIKELAGNEFWQQRFGKLKIERMEEEEFISELFFLTAENMIYESSQEVIDKLFENYSKREDAEIDGHRNRFLAVTDYIVSLNIDYDGYKRLNAPTHLYGLYSIAWYCTKNSIPMKQIRERLLELYDEYFTKKSKEYSVTLQEYKNSCSSRTRSRDQRVKRLNAILAYCGLDPSPTTTGI